MEIKLRKSCKKGSNQEAEEGRKVWIQFYLHSEKKAFSSVAPRCQEPFPGAECRSAYLYTIQRLGERRERGSGGVGGSSRSGV